MLIPAQRMTLAFFTASTVALVGAGCGDNPTRQADKQLRKDLQTAYAQSPAPIAPIEQAAGLTDASPAARVNGKAALGHAEMERAGLARVQLDEKHRRAARLLYEISDLSARIGAGTTYSTGYLKRNPEKAVADIQGIISQAQGKGSAESWLEVDGKPVSLPPTLSAINQNLSRLSGEITKAEDEIARLTEERNTATASADQAFADADNQKGKESVTTFNKGSDARRQASELQIKIDGLELALLPLRQDMKIAETQKASMEQAIASLNARVSDVSKDWEAIQAQAALQNETSGKLASGDQSITSKATELGEVSKAADALAESIATDLRNAATHFADAQKAADELGRALDEQRNLLTEKTGPSGKAIASTKSIFDPGALKLQEAFANVELAGLLADRAGMLATKKQVTEAVSEALSAASFPVPPELDDANLGETLRTAGEAADTQHDVADKLIKDVAGMPLTADARKDSAQIADMLLLHGWSHLMRTVGGADAASAARDKFDEAKDIRDQNITKIALVLPSDLAPELPATRPAVSSPVSSTRPTSAPVKTAQPANLPGDGGELMK